MQCPLLLFENSQYVVAKQIILQLWCSTAWLLNDKQHFYWMQTDLNFSVSVFRFFSVETDADMTDVRSAGLVI